jgi:hypothetical protein
MAELLTCPLDGTPLVMAADDGVFESACHKCRREFRFTRGVLKSIELQDTKTPGYRAVTLRIHAEHETIEVAEDVFEARWSDVKKGRALTTTQQIGPSAKSRLVRVHPHGGPDFNPREPGDQAAIRTAGLVVQGGLATVFATILMMYFYHWAFFAIAPIGAFVVLAAAAWRWKSTSTRRTLDKRQWSMLSREQWLLTQLQRYRLQSADLDSRLKRGARQIKEMEKLASDMKSASGDYEHRSEVVRRGIDALRQHHDSDLRLQRAIEGAMEMVEIEYRAARALQYLPDDAIGRLTATIADLEAIEEESAMLEAQLEATAEVHTIAPG